METKFRIDATALVRHLALETFILEEAIAKTNDNGKEVIIAMLREASKNLYKAAHEINPYEIRTITTDDLPLL